MWVCVFGRCKCRVDGNADNIAIGDGLVTHNADGYAQLADVDAGSTPSQTSINAAIQHAGAIFAIALHASTADGDIIPVFVRPGTGTQT